jgi:hypothetical protein
MPKPYLETLSQSASTPTLQADNTNSRGYVQTPAAFEQVKATLEAAISEKRFVFITYPTEEKKPIDENGKTKRPKRGEKPVFTDTLRRIEPLRFEEGVRGGGLKVISNCAYRQGEERAFFLHKIKRMEDHDWTGTWKESGQSVLWAVFFF